MPLLVLYDNNGDALVAPCDDPLSPRVNRKECGLWILSAPTPHTAIGIKPGSVGKGWRGHCS